MFKNYLKIALRNIKRYKGYSFLNVIGLAIGMAICILILLWLQDELSWDRFHKNGDQIYRITSEDRAGGNVFKLAGSPSPIGPTLVEEYPEVENFTRVQSGWSGWYLHIGDKTFIEERTLEIRKSNDSDKLEIENIHIMAFGKKKGLKSPNL